MTVALSEMVWGLPGAVSLGDDQRLPPRRVDLVIGRKE